MKKMVPVRRPRDVHVAQDLLRELADLYERVTLINPGSPPGNAGGKPSFGPRVPPGAGELLVADEVARALTPVDCWVSVNVDRVCALLTEVEEAGLFAVTAPQSTPARLRFLAAKQARLAASQRGEVAADLVLNARVFLRDLYRVVRSYEQWWTTGERCQRQGCRGRLGQRRGVAEEGGTTAGRALVCSACGDVVPYEVWSRWPRRLAYVTVEHAAKMCGVTVNAVRIRASRYRWHRIGTGKDVRYLVADVMKSREGESE